MLCIGFIKISDIIDRIEEKKDVAAQHLVNVVVTVHNLRDIVIQTESGVVLLRLTRICRQAMHMIAKRTMRFNIW